MNAFQSVKNTSDAVPLYLPLQLYLKPISQLNISIQLPNVKKLGQNISHWEMMEKLRELIKPEEFTVLKVYKTTLEFVRFSAEVEDKRKLDIVISKLNNRSIKMKNFSDLMRVKAAVSKSDVPTRREWDQFFQDAKDMNEMKPGERPDTVHLSHLPIKWFVPYSLANEEDVKPSEKLFYKIFEKYGHIRYVDIPTCDPYRKNMKDHISGLKTSSFDDKEFFEGYVQYKDYVGFNKCMDALRNMQLMHKEDEECLCVKIKVDFDRNKHLSDASIRRREIVRDRLVQKQRDKEEREEKELAENKRQQEIQRQKEIDLKAEKEQRRRIREEKRKAKLLEQLKIKGSDEINEKIAKEERKLLKVQRKLEAIRLVDELFRRVKEKRETETNYAITARNSKAETELKRYKDTSELEVLNQREKLHNAIKGRVMLKTMLQGSKNRRSRSSSSDSNNSFKNKTDEVAIPNSLTEGIADAAWYGYPPTYGFPHIPPKQMYAAPPLRGHPAYMMYYHQRGKGHSSRGYRGRSRGGFRPYFRGSYRGGRYNYAPEIEDEYVKYFSKFLNEHDNRDYRSRSRSRSRGRSRSRYSRSRSHSSRRSRSRRRSYSRSRSRSRSRSKTRSKHKNHRSKSYSRSRSRSASRNKSRSKRSYRSRSKSSEHRKSSKSRERRRSTSIKSVDSSKFISPKSMSKARSKSKEEESVETSGWATP